MEKRLDQNPAPAPNGGGRQQSGSKDLRPAHFRAIKKLVDFKLIARSKLRFAHEALFGVGAGCFDELLRGTTCRVTTLDGAHDPNFGGINPEPIAANYARSSAWLRKHPHDICLVTDGDADRVGGMDGRGNPLTTHQIICLLLHHFIVNRRAAGPRHQGADHDFDGGQNVRALRTGTGGDGRRLQIHLRRDAQGQRPARL